MDKKSTFFNILLKHLFVLFNLEKDLRLILFKIFLQNYDLVILNFLSSFTDNINKAIIKRKKYL